MKKPYTDMTELNNLIASGARPEQIITVGSTEIPSDKIVQNSQSYKTGTSASSSYDLGGCIISSLSFQIEDRDHAYNDLTVTDGTTVVAKVRYTSGTNTYDVPIGTFYIYEHKLTNYSIYISAYDAMNKLDNSYVSITFPTTVLGVINSAIADESIEILDDTFAGNDIVISTSSNTTMTKRQALQYAAQIAGKYAYINSDNKLVIGQYDFSNITGSVGDYFSADIKSSVTYTGVRIYYSGSEESVLSGSEGYVYKLSGNPFVNKDNISSIETQVFSSICEKIIAPGETKILFNPLIEPGDVLNGVAIRGTSLPFPVTSIAINGTLKETIECGNAPKYTEEEKRQTTVSQQATDIAQRVVDEKIATDVYNHVVVYESVFDPATTYDTNTIVIVIEDTAVS